MGTFDDIDLERTEGWTATPVRGPYRPVLFVGAVVIVAAVAGAAWWWLRHPGSSAEIARLAAAVPSSSTPSKVASPPPVSELPPLDALDPTVARLVGELTTSPLLAKWLTTDHLARQIVALVDGAAGGQPPLKLLAPLRPSGTFTTVDRRARSTIAPASFARYDALTSMVTALDPSAVARVYRILSPRLEEAHDELGDEQRSFDESLREGLRRLAETPVPNGSLAVEARGGIYTFADPALEALPPAQKLLLRSGPDNARRVQAWLRSLATALETSPPTTP